MSDRIPDLSATLDEVWQMLGELATRDDPARGVVTLASTDAGHAPQLRTVGLRSARRHIGEVEIFTDHLSRKVNEIRANPQVSILTWEPVARVQLRLSGSADIRHGADVRALWHALDDAARLNYSHQPAPGESIPAADAYIQRPDPGRFAVIRVVLDHIDHVSLADSGHRRASFHRRDGWRGQWLSP